MPNSAFATVPYFQGLFESGPGLYLVLSPEEPYQIVAVSDSYPGATMTRREAIVGRNLFDVFPSNPADSDATGVRNVRASLEAVIRTGKPDIMPVQKYDIRHPQAEGGGFEERYWSPINSPAYFPKETLRYIIHNVEDVTQSVRQKQRGNEQQGVSALLKVRAEHWEAELLLREQEIEGSQ